MAHIFVDSHTQLSFLNKKLEYVELCSESISQGILIIIQTKLFVHA